jgi:hypothetical protein
MHVLMLTIAGSSETRRDRVPVARAYVGVRKRNQEGEGTCGPGSLVGGSKGNQERQGPSSPGFFVGVRKRNQEGEGTCVPGIWVGRETTQQGENNVIDL